MEKIELPKDKQNTPEKRSQISRELDHDTGMVLSEKERKELLEKNRETDAWREQK